MRTPDQIPAVVAAVPILEPVVADLHRRQAVLHRFQRRAVAADQCSPRWRAGASSRR